MPPPLSSSTLLAGDLTVEVTRVYKHLGTLNSGPNRYKSEVVARTAHANKPLLASKKKLFKNKGLPPKQRLTIWKALVLSRLIYHSATWSAMTAKAWQTNETTFHAGLRMIEGPPPFAHLATQSQTDQTIRAALAIPPLQVIVATRRLGLLRRVLASGCPWLLGFIFETRATPRSWGAQLCADTDWLQAREPGGLLPFMSFLQHTQNWPAPRWKARLKAATQGEILRQATQEDLDQLDKFQQEAFHTLGIPVGHKDLAETWQWSVAILAKGWTNLHATPLPGARAEGSDCERGT